MGTMIQGYGLGEVEFRGARFSRPPAGTRKGCNDLLSITQPRIVEEIHERYLEAGADLVETNSFTATSISLADYGLEDEVFAINKAAAEAANRARHPPGNPANPGPTPFRAGSIGPTNRTASLSPDVNDPSFRATTFRRPRGLAYHEQVRGLMAGGVDLLLPETSFDTLNLKAALFAIQRCSTSSAGACRSSPRSRSPTRADAPSPVRPSRRPGSRSPTRRCSPWDQLCPRRAEMRPYIEELARVAFRRGSPAIPTPDCPTSSAATIRPPRRWRRSWASSPSEGWLNLVGGCCGTTPDHIRAIVERVAGALRAHRPKSKPDTVQLSEP